mgnify:FL=1
MDQTATRHTYGEYLNSKALRLVSDYTELFASSGLTIKRTNLDYTVVDTYGFFGAKGEHLISVELVLSSGNYYIHPSDLPKFEELASTVLAWNEEVLDDVDF